MAQVVPIRQCDAKTLRLIIRTVTMEYLDLTPFPTAVLTLYSDPFDNSSIINTWSTDDPTRGFFRDRKNGQVEFYLINSDTADLGNMQYTMMVRLYKDAEHMYTVYQGILDVKA